MEDVEKISVEDCWACERALKQGDDEEEVLADHEDCHGWFHCGNCCGPCPVCLQEGGYDYLADVEDE